MQQNMADNEKKCNTALQKYIATGCLKEMK